MAATTPAIDYTSRDYDGLKASLLEYAERAYPDWKPSSEGDFGVLLVELMAYMGDVLSFYVDRAQNEAYLPTATRMSSVLNIASLLGYKPGTGLPAKATVNLVASLGSPAITVPKGTQLATNFVDSVDGPIIFEIDNDLIVPANPGTGTTPYTGAQNVPVTEGRTIQDSDGSPTLLATADGYPDQVFRLPMPRIYQETIQVYVNGVKWSPKTHILDAGPNDLAYEVTVDSDGFTWLIFGDGVNGFIPALGAPISTRYRTGLGAKGNLPVGQIVTVYSSVPGLSLSMIDSATSTSSAATGGADPEGVESIRTNAPKVFASQQRAVTLDDYASFALAVPGVAKAAATASYFSSVTVYVLGPDGSTPTSALLERVTAYLQGRVLAGVTVNVEAPVLVPINLWSSTLSITVQAYPNYSNSSIQLAVHQAIQNFFSFNKSTLGQRLTVSDLYYVIMGIEGVRYVDIPLMARNDQAQTGTQVIQLLPNEFATLGTSFTDHPITVSGGLG